MKRVWSDTVVVRSKPIKHRQTTNFESSIHSASLLIALQTLERFISSGSANEFEIVNRQWLLRACITAFPTTSEAPQVLIAFPLPSRFGIFRTFDGSETERRLPDIKNIERS